MHFNNVLVYIIVTKRFVTYPDWVEKFRSPGHTIKKTKQGYDLYSCTSKYVPGGKTKCCPSPTSAINRFGIYTALKNPGEQIHLTSSKFIVPLIVRVHNKL